MQIHIYIYIYTNTYIHIYIYIYTHLQYIIHYHNNPLAWPSRTDSPGAWFFDVFVQLRDECMQKGALRHKALEPNRGFPGRGDLRSWSFPHHSPRKTMGKP